MSHPQVMISAAHEHATVGGPACVQFFTKALRPCRLRAFRGVGINLSSGDRGVERRRVLRGR